MSHALVEYLQNVSRDLEAEDWDQCRFAAQQCSLRDAEVVLSDLNVTENEVRRLVSRHIAPPFDTAILLYFKCLDSFEAQRYENAYSTQTQLVQYFAKEILQKRKEENWFLPLLYRFCSDLRLCAKMADARPTHPKAAERSSYLEQAASAIMECYRSCVADIRTSIDTTKRLAILNLTNQLFRIYFKVNKLNLLKPLVRAVENCGNLYASFSIADRVTYKYYTGRKAMFDSDFRSAEESLSFAFKNCYPESHRNKQLILMYLIPVKMFLGHMPSEALLKRYQLMEFYEVAQAVRHGNLLRLHNALIANEPFFIRCGIFLMLEKLKTITYRTLFKKVCHILQTHQVPLDAFLVVLRFLNIEEDPDFAVDADEVACIVANLIAEGKIKGYISHQHQKLVISKQNPFPLLSSIPNTVS